LKCDFHRGYLLKFSLSIAAFVPVLLGQSQPSLRQEGTNEMTIADGSRTVVLRGDGLKHSRILNLKSHRVDELPLARTSRFTLVILASSDRSNDSLAERKRLLRYANSMKTAGHGVLIVFLSSTAQEVERVKQNERIDIPIYIDIFNDIRYRVGEPPHLPIGILVDQHLTLRFVIEPGANVEATDRFLQQLPKEQQ
jgi:hypothetical protein